MKLIIMILLVALYGCANIKVTPPSAYTFTRSHTYQIPYEKIWVNAVDWFADHNVTIDKIEKESGLITAKYNLKASDKFLDCGNIEVNGTLTHRILSSGSLNVTVRKLAEDKTKVNVNFFGKFEVSGSDAWDGRPMSGYSSCVSTGNLEKSILEYIVH